MDEDEPAYFSSARRFDDEAIAQITAKLPTSNSVDPGSVIARVRHLASVFLDQREREKDATHVSKIARQLKATRGQIEKLRRYASRPNRTARDRQQLLGATSRVRHSIVEILNHRPDICKELGFDDPLLMRIQDREISSALGALGDVARSDAELEALQNYLTAAIASIEGRRGNKKSTWRSRAEQRFVTALAKLFGTASGSPATGTTSPDDGSMISDFYLFLEAIFWHVDRSEPPSRQIIQRAVMKARINTSVVST